jgi:hypothetical protein
MKNYITACLFSLGVALAASAAPANLLEAGFQNPPASARPWVFWFWVNGNISKECITKDLEALENAGIGGVLWMEVSGSKWAPAGGVTTLSPQWHDCMQWTVKECARLGLELDLTLSPGYGSGGPWITPETSMQELVWSEQTVEGGKAVELTLDRPKVKQGGAAKKEARLVQGGSYKDVALLAMRLPASAEARAYRIPEIKAKSGLSSELPKETSSAKKPPADAITPLAEVIDLTGKMDADGRLEWEAPPGTWQVMRFGHDSNLKMTRPCPESAVGLECDRLATVGINAHYEGFLKKILTDAGAHAGKTLNHVHIDSWEAGGQNWTSTFPAEFLKRRGYDLRPWLPVLAERVVGSAELSERFLWDVRTTASEMICDNYARRLRELAQKHGIKFSCEAYGKLSIDNLAYAGISDLPISEFWAMGNKPFPKSGLYERSTKAMSSVAHTHGKPVVGAEAFTGARKWDDHPFLLKGMGDQKFCEGLNRMILHCSVHQPYDNMMPGLTHQKWGDHFDRFNTWWNFSGGWIDYLTRSQFLLQQGRFVADVVYWVGEGAPLSVDDMTLELPDGYTYDFCASEIVLQMKVQDGRIVLPSGMSYRYLLLPQTDHMTVPLVNKIRELVAAGARVIGGSPPVGTPGLSAYPEGDEAVREMAKELWSTGRIVTGKTLDEVFKQDRLPPDFEGKELGYIHRQVGDKELYFISNPLNEVREVDCTFRVTGKVPELWNPETGAIRELSDFVEKDGQMTIPMLFDPMQSWFVVFRPQEAGDQRVSRGNFPTWKPLMELSGPWEVSFDAKWGGPESPVVFEKLSDWSQPSDAKIRFYSGTAVYRKSFELAKLEPSEFFLDLGKVEVIARVKLNGRDCGIAWKPPYRVDISSAAKIGKNELEIQVVNLWTNRMIGDEHLPDDSHWEDEVLQEWPVWFKEGKPSPTGRYTFTSFRHYDKKSPLVTSGLLGPVTLQTPEITSAK